MKVKCAKCGREFEKMDFLALSHAIMGKADVCLMCQRNEFFNPDEFDTEVVGFVEELYDVERRKSLGSRPIVGLPTRPLGSPGIVEVKLTEDVTLTRGMNQVTVKASTKKPIICSAMLTAICGKAKHNL